MRTVTRSADTGRSAHAFLASARAEARSGSWRKAWEASREAARIGRSTGDAVVVARAALAMSGSSIGDWSLTASRQALCLEALGMLGPEHGDLREALIAQHAAIATAWVAGPAPADRMSAADADRAFLALQAEHTAAIGPGGTGTRLDLATRAIVLGSAAADDAILAWARLWRLDAVEQLGLRREFNDELVEFTAVVDRLDSPVWRWRLALVHANLALLEDRVDDVPGLADAALRAGEEAGAGDAGATLGG